MSNYILTHSSGERNAHGSVWQPANYGASTMSYKVSINAKPAAPPDQDEVARPAGIQAPAPETGDTYLSTRSGYVFVVQHPDTKSWRFLRIHSHYVDTYTGILNFFPEINEDMLTFWRALAFDRTIPWDGGQYDVSTTRLIQIEIGYRDVTDVLLSQNTSAEELQRYTALSKLTPAEARLLGVEDAYALMLMNRSTEKDPAALLTNLKTTWVDADLIDLSGLSNE